MRLILGVRAEQVEIFAEQFSHCHSIELEQLRLSDHGLIETAGPLSVSVRALEIVAVASLLEGKSASDAESGTVSEPQSLAWLRTVG
jgi:hypothetical protein